MTSTESITRVQDLCRLFCPEAGTQPERLDFVREPVLWTVETKRAILCGDDWIFAWVMDPDEQITGFQEWRGPGPGMAGYVTLPGQPYLWRDGAKMPLRMAKGGRKPQILLGGYPADIRARDLARLTRLDSVDVWGLTPRRTDSAVQTGWDRLAWSGEWGGFKFRGLLRCTAHRKP